MRLIDEFESADEQNVGTFNKIFKFTPIFSVPDYTPVEIHEPATGDLRWVKIGDDFTRINLALSNNAKDSPPNVARPKRRVEFVQPYKNCSKCKEYLHFDNFTKHKNSSGGVRASCKKCCAKQVKRIIKQRNNNELHHTAE
jgi:hypothetical protein